MTAKRKWTEAENIELLRLRDKLNMKWDAIAQAMPGRSFGACQVQYYAALHNRNKSKKTSRRPWSREPGRVSPCITLGRVAIAPARGIPAVVDSMPYRGTRLVSTAELIAHADLRSRIAAQGPNGLLGDPPAGRSALDKKRGQR